MSNKNDEAFVVGVKPHWWSRRRFEVEGIRFRSRETANEVLDTLSHQREAMAGAVTSLMEAHDELSAGHVGALAEAADRVVSLTDEARLLKGRLVAADRAVMAGRAECAVLAGDLAEVGDCLAASRRLVNYEQDQHAQTQRELEYVQDSRASAFEKLKEAREEAVRAGKRAEDREEAFELAAKNIALFNDVTFQQGCLLDQQRDAAKLMVAAERSRAKMSVGALIPDGDGFRTVGGVRVVVGGQPLWRITGGDGVEVKVKDTGEAIRLLASEAGVGE